MACAVRLRDRAISFQGDAIQAQHICPIDLLRAASLRAGDGLAEFILGLGLRNAGRGCQGGII